MHESSVGPEIVGVRRGDEGVYVVTLRDGTTGELADHELVRRGGLIRTVTVSDALVAAVGEATWVAASARLLAEHLDNLSVREHAIPEQALVFHDAVSLADDLVRSMPSSGGAEVVLAGCTEHTTAWAFAYQTRAALGGDLHLSLVGNGPVVVPKDGSAPWFASSAQPLEEQIAAWANDPA